MRAARGITSRAHPLWLAYILHRLSGLGLALFLPFHFWVLAMAMTDPARLDGFLALTEAGMVKLAEFGLVFLLAVHMFGGPAPDGDGMAALVCAAKDTGGGGDGGVVPRGLPLFPEGGVTWR